MASTASAPQEPITFFDIPSRHKGDDHLTCFSFNPWKTRLALNYKHIPYTTHFLEYPDIAPTLSGLPGLAPNAPGTAFAQWTCPAVVLPSSTSLPERKPIMHSLPIAQALEDLYPCPSLHLETGLHFEAEKVVEALAKVVWWDGMVYTQDELLLPRSREYFARTRKEVFGGSLEELAERKGGEGAWREAEREGGVMEGMVRFLGEWKRDDGPFVLGSQVSYADFVVVALFECLARCDSAGWERMQRFDPAFGALYTACKEWLVRDG